VKPKYKILFSCVLLAVVLFASVPKVYIHSLLGHKHHVETLNNDQVTVSENNETKDCNFEKFDTPVYYTVFKFILNFIQVKEVKQTSFIYHQNLLPKLQYNTSPLRGPPTA
jgi:hypothetical protein